MIGAGTSYSNATDDESVSLDLLDVHRQVIPYSYSLYSISTVCLVLL